MISKRALILYPIIALVGVALGSGFTAWYFWKTTVSSALGTLEVQIQIDMAILSEIHHNHLDDAKAHLDGFLSCNIEALNTFASGAGPRAAEAKEMQKRIVAWRSRNPAIPLSPKLKAEVEHAGDSTGSGRLIGHP